MVNVQILSVRTIDKQRFWGNDTNTAGCASCICVPRAKMKSLARKFAYAACFTAVAAVCAVIYSSILRLSQDGRNCHKMNDQTVPLLVFNARVYTVDEKRPWAEAFFVNKSGVIEFVGDKENAFKAAEKNARKLNAKGKFIMPGFQDPHIHVPEAGINELQCVIDRGKSVRAYANRAFKCAKGDKRQWVRASGPSLYNLLNTTELPIDVLDEVIPNRPVYILDDLGHALWANTLALRLAGIAENDTDPQGGAYHRDERTGRLSGLLLENAQHKVRDAGWEGFNAVYDGLARSLKTLAKNGITSISDAGGYWTRKFPEAFRLVELQGRMSVRARNALYVFPDKDFDEQMSILKQLFQKQSTMLGRITTAKIYVDGILEYGTAALLSPYDRPPNKDYPKGFFYFKRNVLFQYALELHKVGFQLHFHAIGDAAVREALDAVEHVMNNTSKTSVRDRRHRITHAYLINPNDYARFVDMGVVADFQVGPDTISEAYAEELKATIGTRARSIAPVSALLQAGAKVSLSSDWDADPLSPLGTIQRSLTRPRFAVQDVATAIRLTTLNAAYALHQDNTTGSISVGKNADFVMLSHNLLKVKSSRIAKTRVLLTAVNGRIVYARCPYLPR